MLALQSMTHTSYAIQPMEDEVHVWCASLKQPAHLVQWLYGLLSSAEKTRAGRYHFQHLRQSFVVARGVLRLLLSRYIDLPPHELEITYHKAGKPQLSETHGRTVFFNLSHSHELALYAISSTHKVGIDLEYIRPVEDLIQIAERNFSAQETAELKSLAPDQTLRGFFHCWTRKEAYIKAIGAGVSFPLHEFDVSLTPGEPAKLIQVAGSTQEAARWSMVDLSRPDGYAAALVAEGNIRNIAYREWDQLDHFVNHQESK